MQASLRSDCSSDSENYVIIGGETGGLDKTFDASDAMFRVTSYADNSMQKVEMASEVLEEEPTGTIVTTPSERADSIDSSIKRRDLVLLVPFIYHYTLNFACLNFCLRNHANNTKSLSDFSRHIQTGQGGIHATVLWVYFYYQGTSC